MVTTVIPKGGAGTLSEKERKEHEHKVKIVTENLALFWETGEALAWIKDNKSYRGDTGKTFDAFCLDTWGFGRVRAEQLIDASRMMGILKNDTSVSVLPTNEAQCRHLAKLPEDKVTETWQSAVEQAKKEDKAQPTEQIVKECVKPPRNGETPKAGLVLFGDVIKSLRPVLGSADVVDADGAREALAVFAAKMGPDFTEEISNLEEEMSA